ncbi:dihydrofolate reductase family protein [Kitasatospora sp. NPDC058965]|uniref:dihydrofolate reductase family protein n=1 Tax=Kitasatospora sp. NPDC058965 TaxID=3346682 RepID=UPI00367A6B3B
MAKTVYYTATTLDGFLADPENSLQWLFEVEEGEATGGALDTAAFLSTIGAMAMGATTYAWLLAHEQLAEHPGKWREWYGERPCFVFSHRELPLPAGAPVRLVRGDVRPLHAELVAAAGGRDVWLMGGGELVGQFADHGLLDEIVATVAPVTLGAGAPLLPRRLSADRLRLRALGRLGQFAQLVYDVRPPAAGPVPPAAQ